MNLSKDLFILLSMLLGLRFTESYEIPSIILTPLTSLSFGISIKDEPGIEKVEFKVNYIPRTLAKEVDQPINNMWMAEFPRPLAFIGTLYVWIKVFHNNVIYEGSAGPLLYKLSLFRRSVTIKVKTNIVPFNNNENNNRNFENPKVNGMSETLTKTRKIPTTISKKHCESSVTEVPDRSDRVCRSELIFEDDFNILNESKWLHEVRAPHDTRDAEFMLYDGRAKINNGKLEIMPMQWSSYRPDVNVLYGNLDLGSRCTGKHDLEKECRLRTGGHRMLPPVVAPLLTTRNSFRFKYGRVEIRAKLPRGDWLNPLLLLEPWIELYGHKGYQSGQIRVAYARGNENLHILNGKRIDGHILYGGAIVSSEADKREMFMASVQKEVHFGNDFHNYSLTWTPDHLMLEVDNQIYGKILVKYSGVSTWDRGSYIAPFDQEFYLALGLSVGGFGDYPDKLHSGKYMKPWINRHPQAQNNFWLHQKEWLNTWHSPELLVDYVRVYAL